MLYFARASCNSIIYSSSLSSSLLSNGSQIPSLSWMLAALLLLLLGVVVLVLSLALFCFLMSCLLSAAGTDPVALVEPEEKEEAERNSLLLMS